MRGRTCKKNRERGSMSTLASLCHLPPAEIAQCARMREPGASHAQIKRPIQSFLGSLVEGEVLHMLSLAETIDQATKHQYPASREPG